MTITRNFSTLANGAGSANTLSLGGATLVSNALAVTGTSQFNGSVTTTGRITQSLSPVSAEYALRSTGQTTGWIAIDMANTGGDYIIAGENSTGNNIITGDSAYDMCIRGPSGISFSANAGATQHMRLDSNGNLNFGSGTRGVVFNNSSASVNSTLNDYEVGTFTPTFNSTTIGGSYTVIGYYTKVGAMVFISVSVAGATSFASTANSSTMTGLPFTLAGSSTGLVATNNYIENFGVAAIYSGTTSYLPTINQSGITKSYFFSGTYRANF